MKSRISVIFILMLLSTSLFAQPWNDKKNLSYKDTLRGSITEERTWWDVLHYDIAITPSFSSKTIIGVNTITYKVTHKDNSSLMQIDLQAPLVIDSIIYNRKSFSFTNDGQVWYVKLPKQKKASVDKLTIYYSGSPHQAAKPPWDGGWIWTVDSLGRPWMSVACQGIGASIWYPCKDHQSDEPDQGATLSITVPHPLVAVANGRLQLKKQNADKTTTYQWSVVNPINNYNISPSVGYYVHMGENFKGIKGDLQMSYWVLDYNYQKALDYLLPEARKMMKSFEYWLGPYPFYKDGYKLVDAPGYGMEHQSAVAYHGYKFGNRGADFSKTGWGLKWDFLLVHESAHEWFGNSITAKDPADKWIQKGFACYADVLYMQDYLSKEAGHQYVLGTRRNIWNNEPIIGPYRVGKEGGSDMYPKARNMLHMIRCIINDEEKFRSILIGMNKRFYHQTVNSRQIEQYISKKSGIDFSTLFDQYLRSTQIPVFEYSITDQVLSYRLTNCLANLSMPVKINIGLTKWVQATTSWQKLSLPTKTNTLIVDDHFYLHPHRVADTMIKNDR